METEKNDAREIAEMMRVGHHRPVQVKPAEAQLIRTNGCNVLNRITRLGMLISVRIK